MYISIPLALAAAVTVNAAQTQTVINDKQVQELYNKQTSLLSAAGYTSIKTNTNSLLSSVTSWVSNQPTTATIPPAAVSGFLAAEYTWYSNFPPSMVKVIQTVIVSQTTFRVDDGNTMGDSILPYVPYMTVMPNNWDVLLKDVKARITNQASSYVSSLSSFGFSVGTLGGIQGASSGVVRKAVIPPTASLFAAAAAMAGALGLAVGL